MHHDRPAAGFGDRVDGRADPEQPPLTLTSTVPPSLPQQLHLHAGGSADAIAASLTLACALMIAARAGEAHAASAPAARSCSRSRARPHLFGSAPFPEQVGGLLGVIPRLWPSPSPSRRCPTGACTAGHALTLTLCTVP